MSRTTFKCTKEAVETFYSIFDEILRKSRNFEEVFRMLDSLGRITLTKNFLGSESFKYRISGNKVITDLPDGCLSKVDVDAIFDDNLKSKLSFLREISFNNSYFYKQEDVLRASEDYGVVGERDHFSNIDRVYAPCSLFPFFDVCEVRDEYSHLIDNGYKKIQLPKGAFDYIMGNGEYKEYFKEQMKKGFTTNRLFEKDGAVFCGHTSTGYKALEYLDGVAYDFYNNLLVTVVGLGKPINSVLFYSDLDWSCILYRKSKRVEGEYEIVIK